MNPPASHQQHSSADPEGDRGVMPGQEVQHGQQQIEQLCSRPQRLRRQPARYTPPSLVPISPQEPADHDRIGDVFDYSAADQEVDSTDTEAGSAEQQQHRPQKRHRGSLIGYSRPVGVQLRKQRKTRAHPIVTMADGSKHVEMAATITESFRIHFPKDFVLSCFQSELAEGSQLTVRLVVDGNEPDTSHDVTCHLRTDHSPKQSRVVAVFSGGLLAGHRGYMITGLGTSPIGQTRHLVVHLQSPGAREQAAAAEATAIAAAAAAGTVYWHEFEGNRRIVYGGVVKWRLCVPRLLSRKAFGTNLVYPVTVKVALYRGCTDVSFNTPDTGSHPWTVCIDPSVRCDLHGYSVTKYRAAHPNLLEVYFRKATTSDPAPAVLPTPLLNTSTTHVSPHLAAAAAATVDQPPAAAAAEAAGGSAQAQHMALLAHVTGRTELEDGALPRTTAVSCGQPIGAPPSIGASPLQGRNISIAAQMPVAIKQEAGGLLQHVHPCPMTPAPAGAAGAAGAAAGGGAAAGAAPECIDLVGSDSESDNELEAASKQANGSKAQVHSIAPDARTDTATTTMTAVAGMLGMVATATRAGGKTTKMGRNAAAESVPSASRHAMGPLPNKTPDLAHTALNAAGQGAACKPGTSVRPSPSHAPAVMGTADTGSRQPISLQVPPDFNMENFRTVAQAFKQLLLLVEHLSAPDELMQRMQKAMLKFLDAEKQDPASSCIAAVEAQYGFVQAWVKRGRVDQVLAALEELFKLVRMAGE